jgi:hypothetical protein
VAALSVEGMGHETLKPGLDFAALALRPGAIEWRLLTGTWQSIKERLRKAAEWIRVNRQKCP